MQNDVRTLAAKAAEIETALKKDFPSGVVPITSQKLYTSTEHKEGVTIEVPFGVAARHLVKGSHRIATPEEHQAFKDDMQQRNEQHRQGEIQKRMATGVFVSPEQLRPYQQVAPSQPVKAPTQPKEVK